MGATSGQKVEAQKVPKLPICSSVKRWQLEPSPRDVRQQTVRTAGWCSERHHPYRPLGTPDLDLPAPRELLHAPPLDDTEPFPLTPRQRVSAQAGPGPSSEQQAKQTAQQSQHAHRGKGHAPKTPPKWCRPNLREHSAADTLAERLKEYRRVMLRVKAGQSFLDVIHAPMPGPEALAIEASARHAVAQTLDVKPELNQLLGPARWLASAQKRLQGTLEEEEDALPFRGAHGASRQGLRRTTSLSKVKLPPPVPKMKMKARATRRHGLTDPSDPYIHFDIVNYLESVSTMPTLMPSLAEEEANATLSMLTQTLRRDSSLHADGSQTARPTSRADELVQYLPGKHDIAVLRDKFKAMSARLDADLGARLDKVQHERAASYRKKSHNFLREIAVNCEKSNVAAEIAAVRYRARMEATQEALLRMKRTDWVRPLLDMLESHARKLPGITLGEKMLAKHLFDTVFQGRDVELADIRAGVTQIPTAEHYQPGVQDVVTLLCRFLNIPVKDLWKWYAESKGLDTCSRIMKAYELRWRLVNPGFTPLKAVQKFMRPVKEIREGFYSEDAIADGASSTGLGSRKQSLVRRNLVRYGSVDAGGAQGSPPALQVTPAAADDNKRRVQFAESSRSSEDTSAAPEQAAAVEAEAAAFASPKLSPVRTGAPGSTEPAEGDAVPGTRQQVLKFSGTFSRALFQTLS